jgi:hypothetical protein
MALLIPFHYHNTSYPEHIVPNIYEVPCHFDVDCLPDFQKYSLHTEYCYGPRQFDKCNIKLFPNLVDSQYKGIPKLWTSKQWACDFASYILTMTDGLASPYCIEVHPPFSDYTDINNFINNFKHFEYAIKSIHENVHLLIENRSGTRYSKSDFLIARVEQIITLCEQLDRNDTGLTIALDLPQIFTAHQIEIPTSKQIIELLKPIQGIRGRILGIHLWGKKIGKTGKKVAHSGDLSSFFNYHDDVKITFLEELVNCFDDGKERYFVPEVNSGSADLHSIIADLESAGFKFVSA